MLTKISEPANRKIRNAAVSAPRHADHRDAYSIPEFCERNGISEPFYYKHKDRMPETFKLGRKRMISREAAARWRAKLEAETAAATAAAK